MGQIKREWNGKLARRECFPGVNKNDKFCDLVLARVFTLEIVIIIV